MPEGGEATLIKDEELHVELFGTKWCDKESRV